MFKSVSKNTVVATLVVMLAAVSIVLLAVGRPVAAHEGEDHSKEVAQTADVEKKTEKVTYDYVAQPGDSYSLIARKAVQTYGKIHKVNLSQAQIIFAETALTQAAHSPVLNQGEKRSIDESIIKDVVDKAGKLTDAQKTAWKAYTEGVNFNTDKVGEKK